MKIQMKLLGWMGVAACAACMSLVAAQEGGESPAPAAADAAPADETVATEAEVEAAPPAPAVAIKPHPADIQLLASKGLMLDVTNTGERLIAVGDHGAILASLDGKLWAQVEVPVQAPLTAVYFVDAKNGWAVGHDASILRTQDGGKSWSLQNFQPELEKPLLDVLFIDNQHGFAIGAYGMFKETLDGGETWSDVTNEIQAPELHLNSITRLGNGDVFIAGEQGTLGVSSDQGKTWTKLTSPYEASMFGALPVGDKGALIFGLRGNIFVSKDVRTDNWTKVETGNVSTLYGGAVSPDGHLLMTGLNGITWITDADGGNIKTVPTPVATSQSSIVAWKGGLIMVGESGITAISAAN
jgi:photosystem II stability/assembly factor-like uncharacterized protein